MPSSTVLKLLLDIESIILELEKILDFHDNDYNKFSSNFISLRAVERDLTIIGEAVNKLVKIEGEIAISSSKDIIGLRNIIIHSYDSIDPATLWKILIKDVPVLKADVSNLLNQ